MKVYKVTEKELRELYYISYHDGLNEAYNEEFVGADKSRLKPIIGIYKAIERILFNIGK